MNPVLIIPKEIFDIVDEIYIEDYAKDRFRIHLAKLHPEYKQTYRCYLEISKGVLTEKPHKGSKYVWKEALTIFYKGFNNTKPEILKSNG
jgi:hypothetical protein